MPAISRKSRGDSVCKHRGAIRLGKAGCVSIELPEESWVVPMIRDSSCPPAFTSIGSLVGTKSGRRSSLCCADG